MMEFRWFISKSKVPGSFRVDDDGNWARLQRRSGSWAQDIPASMDYPGSEPIWCGTDWDDIPVVFDDR